MDGPRSSGGAQPGRASATGTDADGDPEPQRAADAALQDDADERHIDVGVLVAHSPHADREALRSFSSRMTADARAELEASTDVDWRFVTEESSHLPDRDTRRPSDFLDRATQRMVHGPYDVVVVVTDAPVISSRKRFVPGLASPIARTAVVSTRELASGTREEPNLSLDSPAVRWNAATLLLHLLGHVLGAGHRDDGGVMEPFRFDPDRRTVPEFGPSVERYLNRIAGGVPQSTERSRGPLRRLAFYARSTARNPRQVLRAVVQSRAPLLPLSLPRLSTAAVAPTLIIVFSAEAWDVGFHMGDATAALFAAASVVGAALYLLFVQNLTFPRDPARTITEHTALMNVTVLLILLFAMAGLFALVGSIILLIELFVFPENLMSNWPSLQDPAVGTADLLRTGAFITTIGVLSGALAGGLESRAIIRHLTLFLDRP